MNFFTRLSTGFTLFKNSFAVLKENKQLVIFPILSGISLLLVMASFIVSIFAANSWNFEAINIDGTTTQYVLIFLFYFVNYFIVVFFNMALIHCTHLYFQGEEVDIKKGIQYSMSRIGTIFSWALFAATVGTILKAIQENAGFIGKIITGIIGVTWNVATFFVIPVMAYENVNPISAVKRSALLMKNKWGESAAASFSFGLVQFIGIIAVGLPLFFLGALINPVAGVALALIGVYIVIAVISAAEMIFISAIYHNITGNPVDRFNQQMIDHLFEKK
jgi:hypothetical protein